MSEQQPYQSDRSGHEDGQSPPVHGYGQQPPGQQPHYSPYGHPPHVAPKNPALSLLVSFFLPGVGSMINGDIRKGVWILVGYLVSLLLTIVLIGLLGVVGFWIWGMVDAYNGAREWNLRHGIVG